MNTRLFLQAAELADDDRHDPHDSETPEPCRGCGRRDCGGDCPEYIEWLRFSFLVWDAANGGDADARP
jgi:hypothetical protein